MQPVTCKIHLPFKGCLFRIRAKQFGSSVISPVKNILCMHGCLKTATCEHTKIGGIGPRRWKAKKPSEWCRLCLIFRSEISVLEKVEYTCIKTCNLFKRFYRFKASVICFVIAFEGKMWNLPCKLKLIDHETLCSIRIIVYYISEEDILKNLNSSNRLEVKDHVRGVKLPTRNETICSEQWQFKRTLYL